MLKPLLYALLFVLLPASFVHSQQEVFVTASHNTINLYSVNLSTCTRQYIDTLPLGLGNIALTSNGNLFGTSSDSVGSNLYKINTQTGGINYVGHFDIYNNSLVALNDTTLLTEYNGDLYGITTTDVHSFFIGHIGYSSLGDLAWLGNDLYMMAISGWGARLIKITFNNNSYPPIANVTPVGNVSNLSNCHGLATAVLSNTDTALIGFADSNTYILNPIDGSYQLLCNSIIPDSLSASDAASITYLTTPIIIDTVNPNDTSHTAVKNTYSNVRPKLYPNPTRDMLLIEYPYSQTVCIFTDITGKVIFQRKLANGTTEIDTSGLSSGIYFIMIKNNQATIYRQKILKR